ncbi:MAG: HDIG domain-containing protein [Candidatus Krumholzibacteriota bacterium]|nr:HDIG domain-containing protein [Candidatus Krumholzibacteriota bacterium]
MISQSDIEGLFADQLKMIQDQELRGKVVEIWVAGCRRGDWKSIEELKEMPFTLLTDTRGVSFVEHTIAVTAGALALARAQVEGYENLPYPINLDRVVAGGLLHDVGKLLEIEKDGRGGYQKSHSGKCARHPISGAILAAESGADEELLNTIICHAKEGEGRPQVVETIFIHQADFATFDPLVMLSKGQLII